MGGPILLSRQSELAAISQLVDSVATGAHGLVTVRGEAGIGKTTLLTGVIAQLAERGSSIARVALSEGESHLSWAGLRLLCSDMADQEWEQVAPAGRSAILTAIGRGDTAEIEPSLVAFALADLLRARAELQPVALVIDDLHWLDQPTASAVAFAVRACERAPVLLLVAHRPVDLAIDLDRLVASERRVAIELTGLPVSAIHQLVGERSGATIGRTDALRIHAATGGHALHAIEIGRLLAAGTLLDDALVHRSAYEAIASRIEELPSSTREALTVAALAARPTLARVRAAMPDIDVEAELDVAVKHQVVDVRGEQILFVHPLMRSAVIATAPMTQRRQAQFGLAATADDPDERVTLLAAGALGADPDLASELDAAAGRASGRGDLPKALQFARRGIELTPLADTARRVERLLTAAELALAGGDWELPVSLADQAEQLDDSAPTRFRAGVTKFLAIGNRGDTSSAFELSAELLAMLEGHPAMRARVHDLRTQALLRSDVVAALRSADAAVADAIAGGDPDQVRREQALQAMVRVLAGEPVDLERARHGVTEAPPGQVAQDWWADVLSFSDLTRESLAISRAQLAEYQRRGLVHFEAPARSRMVGDLIATGQFAEAIRQAEQWFELQSMVGGVAPGSTRADVAYAAAVTGDRRRAQRELAAAFESEASPIDEVGRSSRACELAAAIGDWQAAAEHGRAARRVAEVVGCRTLGAAPYPIAAVEALVQLGLIDEAIEMAAYTAEVSDRSATPRGAPDVARNAAVIAAAIGDVATALERWTAAEAGYSALDLVLEAARCQLGAGSALRRLGRRSEARQRLEDARHRFEQIGAASYIARAEGEIERLGGRRGTDDRVLTPTEEQVAQLVSAGRSNAEIASVLSVSLRTVESNLTRVYRKIGVRSRTELAAALHLRPGAGR